MVRALGKVIKCGKQSDTIGVVVGYKKGLASTGHYDKFWLAGCRGVCRGT